MTALPSTRALRALDVVEVVPAGCIAVLVKDGSFEPHLHPGELAIVDTTDKERVFGELYAVTIEGGRRGPAVTLVQLYKGAGLTDPAFGIWYAFSLHRDAHVGSGCYRQTIDGPLGFEHWPEKCRGRVVGVMLAA